MYLNKQITTKKLCTCFKHKSFSTKEKKASPERERGCYTWDTGSAVNKGKDHTTKGPSNALNTHSGTLVGGPRVSHDSEDGDVEEQEGGYELSNPSPPERPGVELTRLKQWCWWGLLVVLVCLCWCPYGLPLWELVCSKLHILFFPLHFFFPSSFLFYCTTLSLSWNIVSKFSQSWKLFCEH